MEEAITWLRHLLAEDWKHFDSVSNAQLAPAEVWWKRSVDGSPDECLSMHVLGGAKAYRRWWRPTHSDANPEWSWRLSQYDVKLFSLDDAEERQADVNAKNQRIDMIEAMLTADPDSSTARALLTLELRPYSKRDGFNSAWLTDTPC